MIDRGAGRPNGVVPPGAAAVVGVAAALLAACGCCWVAAQLTYLLAGRGWQSAPFTSSPRLLIVLARSRRPAVAWAAAYRHAPGLGPAWVFWMLLALVGLLVAAAGVWCWLRFLNGSDRSRAELPPARWATAAQERRIAVPTDPVKRRWRIVAGRGRASRRLLAAEDCVSAVCFGPNGSGKTTSLIVPNVTDWDGPVVFTTAKAADLEPVCAGRAAKGPVWVIAPSGAPGHQLSGWSPVAAATEPDSADRIAEWMVESSGMTADPKARPWNAQARKFLKGLLLAAHVAGTGVDGWVEWTYAGEKARDHVEDILTSAGWRRVATEYSSTWQIHEEGKGSVLFTALGLADTYTRPGVAAAAARHGFDPDALLDSGGTLAVVTPNSDGDRFAPYFTTLISSVVAAAEARAAEAGGPLTPRLLLALDEAGNVFRYPRLPHLLTTARGNGIQLLLVYHDLAQVEHHYGGREVARTICSNAKMRMLLPGVADLDTLRYWSALMGQTRTRSHGETRGADGHRSTSTSDHVTDLAPLHRLQQLPDGHAVLLYQNLPPAQVRLLPWYADSRYGALRRVGRASPATAPAYGEGKS